MIFFFFSSRRRHTRFDCDWSSDVCSSDLRARARRREQDVRVGDDQGHRGRFREGRREDRSQEDRLERGQDRKSTRLNSSHSQISYAVFCLKKKKKNKK